MNGKPDSKKPARPDRHGRAEEKRTGLPNPANIVGERELRSPTGKRYRIIKTSERDEYDKPETTDKS